MCGSLCGRGSGGRSSGGRRGTKQAGCGVPPVWHCSSQPGVPYHGRGLPASARTQRSPAQNQCLVALGPGSGSGSGVCVVAIGSRHVSSTEVRTGASIMMVGSAAALLPRHPDAYRQGGRGPAAWVALQVRRRGGAALLATEQHVAQGPGGRVGGALAASRAHRQHAFFQEKDVHTSIKQFAVQRY